MTEADVRKLLRAKLKDGLRAFCREHGDLDPSHVGRVANKGAPLSPAILSALGLEIAEIRTLYRRKRK